jgi:SHS2 domain-containing protein
VAATYRLLDHTADLAFEVEAGSWPELLAAATAALGDLILTDDGRGPAGERAVEVTGADREDVLVAWLGAALLAYEEQGLVPRGARVAGADERSARGSCWAWRRTRSARRPTAW